MPTNFLYYKTLLKKCDIIQNWGSKVSLLSIILYNKFVKPGFRLWSFVADIMCVSYSKLANWHERGTDDRNVERSALPPAGTP